MYQSDHSINAPLRAPRFHCLKREHPTPPPSPHALLSAGQTQPPTVDPSTLSDEELLGRLKEALSGMGGGSSPDPDVPFYTLGLSSMTAAQFSGLLEQVRQGDGISRARGFFVGIHFYCGYPPDW